MKKQFIKVKTCTNSHHVFDINLIEYISPKDRPNENKSEIKLINNDQKLYSIETPVEILDRLENLLTQPIRPVFPHDR